MYVLISVIIPVYNTKRYLKESMYCVLKQTYSDLEIIIVDDGSTDGSGEICDRYADSDSRVKVIHQKNRGLGVARNVGLQAVTGEAILFLDSDDVMCLDTIQSMKRTMDAMDADMVICGFHKFSEVTPKFKTRTAVIGRLYDKKDVLKKYIRFDVYPVAWGKLYKRDLLSGLNYIEGRKGEAIVPTYQIIKKASKIYITDEKLFLYRQREDSITGKPDRKMKKDFLDANVQLQAMIIQDTPEIFSQDEAQRLIRVIERRILDKEWRKA